ncbi:ParB/RepB/Spo0J family partition protein [candidate division CSSED10-310 bacterium]|uniref:ParB/RepB/Spo0J family partition protein n=1 Tax=candidate division CSSED10-310 bacterium TaxID=2855610 RepID=A0ABV6YU96_UNCC1
MPKKALGKGLEALLPKGNQKEAQALIEIPLDHIDTNPHQPRKDFSAEQLEELAASISDSGVLQPIIVQQQDQRYIIVIGERRVRASRLAGKTTIPAIVKKYSPKNFLRLALIENIQREDLNPIEQAFAFKAYMEQFKVTQEELAAQLNKDRSVIANTVRLLNLPPVVQDQLRLGAISAGHARNLLSLKEPAEQIMLSERIMKESWSVRETEQFFKKARRKRAKKAPSKIKRGDPHLNAVREQMIRYLGTKVTVVPNNRGGQIIINYFDEQDFNRLVDLILK